MAVVSLWLALVLGLPAAWNASDVVEEGTLEFRTVGPDEGEHWSTVWFVVLDGEIYLRLGPRAATRVEKNTEAPYLAIRLDDVESRTLRAEAAPEMAGPVAEAMADKYWTDVLGEPFRKLGLTSPTVTLRLVAETGPRD